MLAKHNIKSVSVPPRKIYSCLPPVKDTWDWDHQVYTASQVNVGRFKLDKVVVLFKLESKKTTHIQIAQTDKSAGAEHSINQDHIIKL
jgi:hypothetical protein